MSITNLGKRQPAAAFPEPACWPGADLVVGDLREELPRAGDLGFLDVTELERGKVALGLGDEIDVLHLALLEGDGPVRVVVAHGRGDEEGLRQLGIDDYLGAGIEVIDELPLHGRVGEDVVVDEIRESDRLLPWGAVEAGGGDFVREIARKLPEGQVGPGGRYAGAQVGGQAEEGR